MQSEGPGPLAPAPLPTPPASRAHPSALSPPGVRGHRCPPASPRPSAGWGETSQTSPQVAVLDPPLLGRGGTWGESPPTPPRTLASRLHGFCVVFFFFFNTANVYHLPNRLDRFCFLSSGAAVKPPRLPRSRLPAPSRADLVFRAAPRRISVCKTKCFDGGRLQECLEAVWSFMGCAARSVLARSPRGALDGPCRFFPAERRLPERAALAGRRERGNYVRTGLFFFAPELKNRDF